MSSNDSPWFVGQGCKVPGSPFEWVVLVLAGNYALVGNIYQPGGNVRLVAVGMLSRPVVIPKAIPGERYHSGLNKLAIYVGLKDGRFYDTQTGLIWAHNDPEILRRELTPHPLPVIFANEDTD